MPASGSNLPDYRSVQLDFAAHIRNPQLNPRPADIEPRRMQIYLDLFFNNIKNFIDSAFPVSRQIVGESAWRELIREFVDRHGSQSPYFLQISEEFLTFLHDRGLLGLPAFLLELCHYEWVELSLDVADQDMPVNYSADFQLSDRLLLNPVMRVLIYDYPVHQIGPERQPSSAPVNPSYLIALRDTALQVRFVESNPVTHRLIELLREHPPECALQTIREELATGGRRIDWDVLVGQGRDILRHLHDSGVVLGKATDCD